ncbi:hypothetical protein LK494_01605 [Anaerovorax odorimutans]|nr:hypothetical protein [Anaerovorax odorimutans]
MVRGLAHGKVICFMRLPLLGAYNFFAMTKKFHDIQLCGNAALNGEYRIVFLPFNTALPRGKKY